jgi:DNA-binding MarR family transcriptional regulator/N-acetylglutamate synthase-like GNAT family acetyltransferase
MNMHSRVAAGRIDTVRAFNRFYTQKIGVLGGGLLDSDYSLTEVRVLYEIAHRENALAIDLVRDLGLDAGYLSRILGRFQKRGWLTRKRSHDDARKSLLQLTPRGRRMFASLETRARDEIGQLLAPLPSEEQAKLQGHLEHVQALLGSSRRKSEEIILREHRPGDMGWIVHKHGVLYAQEHGWNEQFEALVAEICAKFLRSFDPSGERCWVAERDGAPVGCVMLVRQSRTIAKLRLLLVDPAQRGRGVGEKLVDECLRFACEAGYRKVTLWTQSILAGARRIYEAKGFKLVTSEAHESFGAKLIGETWELTFDRKTAAARPVARIQAP